MYYLIKASFNKIKQKIHPKSTILYTCSPLLLQPLDSLLFITSASAIKNQNCTFLKGGTLERENLGPNILYMYIFYKWKRPLIFEFYLLSLEAEKNKD